MSPLQLFHFENSLECQLQIAIADAKQWVFSSNPVSVAGSATRTGPRSSSMSPAVPYKGVAPWLPGSHQWRIRHSVWNSIKKIWATKVPNFLSKEILISCWSSIWKMSWCHKEQNVPFLEKSVIFLFIIVGFSKRFFTVEFMFQNWVHDFWTTDTHP